MAAGGLIVGAGLELYPIPGKVHVPMKLFAAFGGLFLGAGLLVFFQGLAGARRKRRAASLKELRPSEPWFWDYPWNERKVTDEAGWNVLKNFFGVFVFGAFLAPFNYFVFAFKAAKMPAFPRVIIGLFDVVVLGVLLYAVYLTLRWLKYGSSTLFFHRFPYYLGEELDASLDGGRGFQGFEKLKITLQAVQVRMETRGSGKNQNTSAVADRIWSQVQELGPEEMRLRGREFQIQFRLPPKPGLSSALSGDLPRYWELIVEGEAPGVDYRAAFLVPVYAKS